MRKSKIRKELVNSGFVMNDKDNYYNENLGVTIVISSDEDENSTIVCKVDNDDMYSVKEIKAKNYIDLGALLNYVCNYS